jgi:hypothetical protein
MKWAILIEIPNEFMNEFETERRLFLKHLTYSLAGAAFGSAIGCAGPIYKSNSNHPNKGKVFLCMGDTVESSTLRIIDWNTFGHVDYKVPVTWAHSILQHSVDPNIIYVFENLGSCARLNLETRETVKVDHRTTMQLFSGHGVSDRSGEFLFCSQIPTMSDQPSITVRNAHTLEIVDTLKQDSQGSHQIVHLPNSNVIAWGNMRSLKNNFAGAITFYDYAEKKIISSSEFKMPVLHVLALSSNEVVGVSFPANLHIDKLTSPFTHTSKENSVVVYSDHQTPLGPMYYAKSDGTHKEFWSESQKDFFNYNFGLAGIKGGARFLSGHLGSGKVILWKNFEIEKVFSVPNPLHIAVSDDGSEFMVLSNGVEVYSLESLSKIHTIPIDRPVAVLSGYKNVYGKVTA